VKQHGLDNLVTLTQATAASVLERVGQLKPLAEKRVEDHHTALYICILYSTKNTQLAFKVHSSKCTSPGMPIVLNRPLQLFLV